MFTLNALRAQNKLQFLLQDIDAEQPGPGDDAALARMVSSNDEVGWSQQLGLSQESFGFLVAGENGIRLIVGTEKSSLNTERQHSVFTHHKSGTKLTAKLVCLSSLFF